MSEGGSLKSEFMGNKEAFVEKILDWHKRNERDFVWRKTRDPYKVLVAEIMLQKTDAKKVSEIYDGFIEKYPNPYILANAPLSELRKDIMLLGIHKRAERLKNLAGDVIKNHGGDIPPKKEDLLELPGVGEYISNAVLCFAFGKDAPLLDANVIRVLERAFSIKSPKQRPRTDKNLWAAAERLIPKGKAREYNFALLDFAANVCTARNPKHENCIVRDVCNFYTKRT